MHALQFVIADDPVINKANSKNRQGLTEILFLFFWHMPQKGGNLQAGKFGQIDEGVVRQDGHHVVTQIEPGKRTQMAQSL